MSAVYKVNLLHFMCEALKELMKDKTQESERRDLKQDMKAFI